MIPTWNRASILRETLEALCLVRTGKLSVSFVVVDNASTDETPAVLREFAQRLPLSVLREPRARQMQRSEPWPAPGPYPAQREPFGPNFWVCRSALAGFEFRSDLGPHPTRRTLCDESEFLRRMRRQGHEPIYSPSARMVHRVQADRRFSHGDPRPVRGFDLAQLRHEVAVAREHLGAQREGGARSCDQIARDCAAVTHNAACPAPARRSVGIFWGRAARDGAEPF